MGSPLESMVPTPLFMGVPGGIELLILLFMMIFGFLIPPVIAAFLYRWLSDSGDVEEERVERLEREIDELRRDVDGTRRAGSGTTEESG